jgi:hypothetical protein
MNDFDFYPSIYGVDDEMKEYEMNKRFKTYNVIKERVELYKDFTLNLLYYIYDTYLGKDYVKTELDIRGHFTWCYRKVLIDFEQEGLFFYENEELYDYFYGYYLDQFYLHDKIQPISHYEKFWENIFEINKTKKRNIFEVLLELYEIFDKTINKKTDVVEFAENF